MLQRQIPQVARTRYQMNQVRRAAIPHSPLPPPPGRKLNHLALRKNAGVIRFSPDGRALSDEMEAILLVEILCAPPLPPRAVSGG